jgi:two-component system sensor kinase FixL
MAVEPDTNPRPWEPDELFQALIATVVDGIVVIDPEGVVQVYNAACTRLFGYPPEEVIGRNVRMLMPEPYRAEHDGYLSHYRGTGEKRIIGIGREVVGRRKDSSTFPMYLSVGEGRLRAQRFFVGIIRDLSEIKTQTAARQSSDRLLAQIVQSSDDAIISKTLDGMITSWNASAERIFGYSAAEAVGRNIAMLFPPELLAEEENITAHLRAGQEIDPYETVRRHKDDRDLMVLVSVAPIRDGTGRVVGASKTARDITQRKQAEFQTQKLQSELAHVARLSAMGQMSAAIAHELNQPLTAVTNYVKAAHRMLGADQLTERQVASARDAMEKAASQTLRAGNIIRSLREFVEKRDSDKTREDINAVVQEAAALGLVGSASSSIDVILDLSPELSPVMMDRIQIQQVLINLIRNSIEAMAAVNTRQIIITTTQDGPAQVSIVIRDTGPGLAAEVQQKLFQPFVTTKQQGMGIGLMICQSIIEAHGGSIRSVSDASGGAAFQIRLPARAMDDETGAQAGS